MTSLEAYKKFLLKLNKNDTNTKIKISKGEFVLLFNEMKRKWLYDKLTELNSSDLVNELSDIYIVDKKLSLVDENDNKSFFKLPDDFQKTSSSYTIAEKDNCVKKLYNIPKKPKNINQNLQNSNNTSDFEFEQAITEESSGNLVIHVNNFKIKEQYLNYYKEPIDIDIEGYIKIDGTKSKTIDSELSDRNVEQIINRCVIEASLNYENAENVQLSQLRNK